MRSKTRSVSGGKYAVILLTILAASCNPATTKISKDERMNGGLSISVQVIDNNYPFTPDRSMVSVVKVKIINDGAYKIKTDVVCERREGQSAQTKAVADIVVESYTTREVYFGFTKNRFYRTITCRLEEVELLDWDPFQ